MKIISSGRGLNSPKFYKKKKRERRIRLIIFSIGFLTLLSSLVYFSRHERLLIAEVVVVGEDVIDKGNIIALIQKSLDGYYFWLIPKSNALLFPRKTIKKDLYQSFPRFKDVSLNLSDLNTLALDVEEYKPFALYCEEVLSPVGVSECYFIDKKGFIFARAPSFSSAVYFVYATENMLDNPLGNKFITTEEFEILSEFLETLATLDIYPVALEIREGEYSLVLPGGGDILWRRDDDLVLMYHNLEAFLSSEAIKSQTNFLEEISNLDLRTINKVFYKFKE